MKLSKLGVLLLVFGLVFATGCLSIFQKEYTISGTVVDENEDPIEGVELVITGGTSTTAETDEEGNFTATVKGKITVTPKHEDYAFEPADMEVEKAKDDLDFVGTSLDSYNISGTVLDKDGAVIPDAKVIITGHVEKEVKVGAEGNWEAEDVKGEIFVSAKAPSYAFNTLTVTEESHDLELVGEYTHMIAWYMLDETSGDTIIDSSWNDKDATLFGTLSSIEGPDGKAIAFNGDDNYIQMPDGILSELDEVTIATWVKTDEDRYWSRVFSFGNNDGDEVDGVLFLTAQGSNFDTDEHLGELKLDWAAYDVPDSAVFVMGPKLTFGQWYHVAVTITADKASLYVDGELIGDVDNIAVPSDLGFTEQNYIGKCNTRWPDPLLKGAFDDFRIYSKALSANEIATLADVE